MRQSSASKTWRKMWRMSHNSVGLGPNLAVSFRPCKA